jgi:hypothetical protein
MAASGMDVGTTAACLKETTNIGSARITRQSCIPDHFQLECRTQTMQECAQA